NQGYGHLREPLLRASAVIRAFHPKSNSTYFKLSRTEGTLFQSPYHAPTVFNFFEPDYIDPGVVAGAGLFSPELQIATENSNVTYINTMYNGVYNAGGGWPGSDVSLQLNVADAGSNSEVVLAA